MENIIVFEQTANEQPSTDNVDIMQWLDLMGFEATLEAAKLMKISDELYEVSDVEDHELYGFIFHHPTETGWTFGDPLDSEACNGRYKNPIAAKHGLIRAMFDLDEDLNSTL